MRLKGPDIKVPQLPKNITATRPITAISVKSLSLDIMLSYRLCSNPSPVMHDSICVRSQNCLVIKKEPSVLRGKRTVPSSAVRASKQQLLEINRI